MEQQKTNKPNFKLIILISLILLAGILDITTTFIGTQYFGLYETNFINRVAFPLGIVMWVGYALCLVWLVERYHFKWGFVIQCFFVGFCYGAPLSNLVLIWGA